jgi:mRNA interferase HigB
MKVHLIKSKTVRHFAKRHASSITAFEDWLTIVKNSDWETTNDMKITFGHRIDLLGNNSKRAVFDIAGNNYRIICKYQFGNTMVHLFVTWIGTHAAYSRICREGRQYTIEKF